MKHVFILKNKLYIYIFEKYVLCNLIISKFNVFTNKMFVFYLLLNKLNVSLEINFLVYTKCRLEFTVLRFLLAVQKWDHYFYLFWFLIECELFMSYPPNSCSYRWCVLEIQMAAVLFSFLPFSLWFILIILMTQWMRFKKCDPDS